MQRFFFLLLGWAMACGVLPAAAQTTEAALASHRTVAILPLEVTQPQLSDIRYATADSVPQAVAAARQQQARLVGYQMQELLAAQLLAQQPAKGYSVAFQPIAETNRRLQAAGITYENLLAQSMPALAQALGVDAVLSGQVMLFQFLPKGVGLAARLLLNEPILPNDPGNLPPSQTAANLTLHDCHSGQLAWRFDFARTGNNALKPERLAPKLVRAALPSFPYCRP